MPKKTDTDRPNEPQPLEARMDRIEASLEELKQFAALNVITDPNRAYSDEQVCLLLGGISRSSLWRLRRKGHLKPTSLLPADAETGEGVNRTLGQQIVKFLDERERESNPLEFTGTGRRRKGL